MFFKARRDGTIELQLDPVVCDVVGRICAELRESLAEGVDDPSMRRLFPTAYTDAPERERAYAELVRDDLVGSRLLALDTVAATIDDDRITTEQAEQWMAALNAVRLTLGTRLDVSEDRDPVRRRRGRSLVPAVHDLRLAEHVARLVDRGGHPALTREPELARHHTARSHHVGDDLAHVGADLTGGELLHREPIDDAVGDAPRVLELEVQFVLHVGGDGEAGRRRREQVLDRRLAPDARCVGPRVTRVQLHGALVDST